MLSAQPLARLSVMAPSIVVCRIPSKDVQVELLRVVQPPDDDQVMPAALSWLAAEAWVTAEAGRAPSTIVRTASTTAAARERGRTRAGVDPWRVMLRTLGAPGPLGHPHDRAVHEPAAPTGSPRARSRPPRGVPSSPRPPGVRRPGPGRRRHR